MRGVLALQLELWVFESPGGLQVPTFGSVGFTLTLSPKWGCDIQTIGPCRFHPSKCPYVSLFLLLHCLPHYYSHQWGLFLHTPSPKPRKLILNNQCLVLKPFLLFFLEQYLSYEIIILFRKFPKWINFFLFSLLHQFIINNLGEGEDMWSQGKGFLDLCHINILLFILYLHPKILIFIMCVATPLWAKCESEAHIPKSGNLESFGTLEILEL